jgi:hypothetical protein
MVGLMMNNSTHEFERLLGKAALALWSDFPRDVQQILFETAVGGEIIIRNHLASYLHDHHRKRALSKADAVSLRRRIAVTSRERRLLFLGQFSDTPPQSLRRCFWREHWSPMPIRV